MVVMVAAGAHERHSCWRERIMVEFEVVTLPVRCDGSVFLPGGVCGA